MRRLAPRLAAGLVCALAPLVCGNARAAGPGYQVDRFEPPPAGDPFAAVESPWYSSTRPFAAGLSLDYARNPLIRQHTDASGNVVRDPAPIANELTGRLDLAASLFDRAALSLSAPLVLQSGTRFADVGPTGMAAGDPRVGLRGRIFGQPDSALSISASTYVWFPIGEEKNFTGDAGPRFLGRATAGGLVLGDRVRWGFNAGYLGRRTARLSDKAPPAGNAVGSELQAGAALNYVMLDRRLSFGPEATLGLALARGPWRTGDVANLELFAAAHYLLGDTFLLGAGAGVGVAGAPGPPDFRLLFSFAYAPVRRRVAQARPLPAPADRDHDGIADARDACPSRAGVASADPSRNGCPTPPAKPAPLFDGDGDGVPDAFDACPTRRGPASTDPVRSGCPAREKVVLLPDADGHVGGIEIDDGHTKIVLDRAYASAEIGQDGALTAVPAAEPQVIDRAVGPMAAGLPVTDADHDGVRDAVDACPFRPGVPSPDPIRNGCPKTAEKLIVLPDADGHVGAVQVTSGKGSALIDHAYGSSELDPSGKVNAVPDSPPEAALRSLRALAAALPPADRDDDGILDAVDACPDRPGVGAPDAAHNGCPKTIERVVVLPDENGHIGAVEVDDGTTKTLVDGAYGSVEMGADLRSRAIVADSAEVARTFGRAMAARPPGARMIIFFTARAEPVRDLTGPIDSLAAEIKEKADAVVSVVGHTDEVGAHAVNMKIGLERAKLIADRLVAAGIPRERIQTSSKGDAEPAVRSRAANVAELRNRRVEVFVK